MQELQDLALASAEFDLSQGKLRCSILGYRKRWHILGKDGRLCKMHFRLYLKLGGIIEGGQ